VIPVAGITLTAGATELLADGISSTTITATLVTSSGDSAPDGTGVTFTTDIGQFGNNGLKTIAVLTAGGGVVVPFISEAGVSGTAHIVASAGEVTQTVEIAMGSPAPPSPVPPPIIALIDLEALNDSLIANGTSSTTITALLLTTAGEPAPDGIVVNFITDNGRFSTDGAKAVAATITNGNGSVSVPFISEKDVVGMATIVANVGGVAQSTQIDLIGPGGPGGPSGPGAPAQITLTADAIVISLSGTTGIEAEVVDDEGNRVADGTAVSFTTNLPGTGVTPIATTTDGVATASFSAGTSAGVATVTAIAGSATAAISITIQAGAAGSLEFVSADPILIGVRGSALPQKSTITFRVRGVNGNPATDGTQVTFTLISGPGGGETIAPSNAGTLAGLASTVLTSGTVSGPVRVLASVTVGSTTLTSSSTNVSITGGPPSGAHIGVAPAFRNIAGLVTQGIICPIAAIVGDRFGNPVPQKPPFRSSRTAVWWLPKGSLTS